MKLVTADVIASLLITLFGYTAFTKALSMPLFLHVLQQVMPKTGAALIAPLIPTLEAFIVLLLLFSRTRLKGLYAALALLTLFTIYLIYLLVRAPHLPCSCGGIISALSWKQHVVLNLIFSALTLVAIQREKSNSNCSDKPVVIRYE